MDELDKSEINLIIFLLLSKQKKKEFLLQKFPSPQKKSPTLQPSAVGVSLQNKVRVGSGNVVMIHVLRFYSSELFIWALFTQMQTLFDQSHICFIKVIMSLSPILGWRRHSVIRWVLSHWSPELRVIVLFRPRGLMLSSPAFYPF